MIDDIVVYDLDLIELLEILMENQIFIFHELFVKTLVVVSTLLRPWPLSLKRIYDLQIFFLICDFLGPSMLAVRGAERVERDTLLLNAKVFKLIGLHAF